MLDRVSQQAVLASLRAQASEGVIGPNSGLADWLEALAMDPADVYGVRGAGFTSLRRELGWLPGDPHPLEESLTRAIGAGLLHLDDPDRLRATADALALLWQASAWRDELRQLLLLLAERTDRRLHPLPWALPIPVRVHGRYSRAEIEAAHCCAEAFGYGILRDDAPWIHREGVLRHQASQCDLLSSRATGPCALRCPHGSVRPIRSSPGGSGAP